LHCSSGVMPASEFNLGAKKPEPGRVHHLAGLLHLPNRRMERVAHGIRDRRSDRCAKVRAGLIRIRLRIDPTRPEDSTRSFTLAEGSAPHRLRETAKGIRRNASRGGEGLAGAPRRVSSRRKGVIIPNSMLHLGGLAIYRHGGTALSSQQRGDAPRRT
jgi:hypothetical protein